MKLDKLLIKLVQLYDRKKIDVLAFSLNCKLQLSKCNLSVLNEDSLLFFCYEILDKVYFYSKEKKKENKIILNYTLVPREIQNKSVNRFGFMKY